MGTVEAIHQRTILALTLKIEGGMWLRASRRAAAAPERDDGALDA